MFGITTLVLYYNYCYFSVIFDALFNSLYSLSYIIIIAKISSDMAAWSPAAGASAMVQMVQWVIQPCPLASDAAQPGDHSRPSDQPQRRGGVFGEIQIG